VVTSVLEEHAASICGKVEDFTRKKFNSSCHVAYLNMGCYVAFSCLLFMLAGTVTKTFTIQAGNFIRISPYSGLV